VQSIIRQAEAIIEHYNGDEIDIADCEIINEGERSLVVVCPGPDRDVLKSPRTAVGALGRVQYEAAVLEKLEVISKQSPPPLEVPVLQDSNDTQWPYWNAMSYVGGRVLGVDELEELSDKDHAELGAAAGQFAGWLAVHFTDQLYQSMRQEIGMPNQPIPNRIQRLERYAGGRGTCWLAENGYPALDSELEGNYRMYLKLSAAGKLQPSVIGHDDLGWHNVMMKSRMDGGWRPSGVIDFETLQPTTPECELRHMWLIGETAGRAAKDNYEAATGVVLDERLLHFWAVAQLLTNMVFSVNLAAPFGGSSSLAFRKRQIQRLAPYEDWSELDKIDFGDRKSSWQFLWPSEECLLPFVHSEQFSKVI
jgi:aminoglycoside phosphotransferase (APT) family kinase protein